MGEIMNCSVIAAKLIEIMQDMLLLVIVLMFYWGEHEQDFKKTNT